MKMTKPPLYEVVDFLYNSIMDSMPQSLQERPMASAFVLGAGGIFGVVKSLQWASKHIMDWYIKDFDEKWLPALEKICIVAMVAVPVLYASVDPESAQKIMTQHHLYTSGMAGVYVGSIGGALQDLHNRSIKSKPLQDLVKS